MVGHDRERWAPELAPGPPRWRDVFALIDQTPAMVAITVGPAHVVAYISAALGELVGAERAGSPAREALAALPEWLGLLDEVWATGERQVVKGGPLDVESAGQVERHLLDITYVPLREEDPGSGTGGQRMWGVIAMAFDVTAEHAAAERSRRAEGRARIATELSRTLEFQAVADAITSLATELLGGWSLLDVYDTEGVLRRVSGRHHHPAMQPLVQSLLEHPRLSAGPAPSTFQSTSQSGPQSGSQSTSQSGSQSTPQESYAERVARTGRPLAGRFDAEALAAAASDPQHRRLLRTLLPSYYLIVPLRVGTRRLGALSVLRSSPEMPFGPRDRATLEEIADRASLALAHARAFDQARQAALTFQRNLLPAALPTVAGVELATRYRAGERGAEVGGDWYDAIALPEGRLGVVLGDVEGHDLTAAAVMGQVRSVVRALAEQGYPPGALAEMANSFLIGLRADRLVTLTYAQVHPAENLVVMVRAGHVPAIVLSPGAEYQLLEGAGGLPLGVHERGSWRESTITLDPGTLLALFSDGLVEAPAVPLDTGMARVARALELARDRPIEVAADAMMAAGTGRRRDDIALVLMKLVGVPGASAASGYQATRRLPATASSAPVARHFLNDLLASWGVGECEIDVAALLTSELVTNAARHADSHIGLRVSLEPEEGKEASRRRLTVSVYDDSHRMPHMLEVGPEDTSGRGLHLVETLSDRWGVHNEEIGKAVWFELAL